MEDQKAPSSITFRFSFFEVVLYVSILAVCFALIRFPSVVAAELLEAFQVLTGCTALVFAFHSSGRKRSFSLGYGIFTLGMIFFGPIPDSFSTWVWKSITMTQVTDLTSDAANLYLVSRVIDASFGIFVAALAGSVTASFCGK